MQREGGKKGVLKQAQELVNRGVGNGLKREREREDMGEEEKK